VPDVAALQRVIDCGALALRVLRRRVGRLRRTGEVDQCRDAHGCRTRRTGDGVCLFDERLVLNNLGSHGDIIVDGPFADNPLFGPMLAALRTGRSHSGGGTVGGGQGAFRLANPLKEIAAAPPVVKAAAIRGLEEYRHLWQQRNRT